MRSEESGMSWCLKVTRVRNGYILEHNETDLDLVDHVTVVEMCDREHSELWATKNMLYEVMDYFGVFHSKHNKYNIHIDIKKNDEND